MSGSIESIATSLSAIAKHLPELTKALGTAGWGGDDNTSTAPADDAPAAASKPASKKVASKKVASKKTAAKKAKADDYSDIQVYKRKLLDVADASGVDNVMPKLKAFLKANKYATSDEIEVDDRAEFLESVKEHFAELADAEGEGESQDELDI